MDTGTPISLVPNRVLRELRDGRAWGRPRLAKELHRYCATRGWSSPGEPNIEKQIYRLETGRVRRPDPFYARLIAEFFDRSPAELFGPSEATTGSAYRIRSHKFVPLYVGAEAVAGLRSGDDDAASDWLTGQQIEELELAGARAMCWPFGVVMFHLVEELEPESVAWVAVWRRLTYDENMQHAVRAITEHGLDVLSDPYVLSAYWVNEIPHDGPQQDSALRLLCVPRVLVSRHETGTPKEKLARASVVEQAFLRDGFDHPDISEFGVRTIATGLASWSGVVYQPHAHQQCLAEDELVACELSVQAAWAYTDYLRQVVEGGEDPQVPPEYGWRYLRGVRSRLTTERPQETSQHRAMREAIVNTSGLLRRLDQAIDSLRDSDRR
ncbi:helix-turn-helix transcriptional regulator [Pseudonocardia kongjuensis]|uniref:Helix-turn-helix transcriptional regulator n=1 Tax=Pseudonocardia kongjuensis TaxID=102227 RepID=A0ABP4ILA3_9PSEU